MPRKVIVVVNGHPRSGKDTAVSFLQDICAKNAIYTDQTSSIEPVFIMLRKAGIKMNRQRLTDADRDLLAEVGSAVEKHSNFRTNAVFRRAMRHLDDAGTWDAVFWVHMREPENIKRLRALAEEAGIKFRTLFVDRPGVREITSNVADSSVKGMEYDVTLSNAGTLKDLKDGCVDALNALLELSPA